MQAFSVAGRGRIGLLYLQNFSAVLDAIVQPGIQKVLHGSEACAVVQTGEETRADGAGHGGRGGDSAAHFVKRLKGIQAQLNVHI